MRLPLLLVALVAWSGCDGCTRVAGPVLEESAVVDDVVFQPSQHGTGVGLAMDGKGRLGPTITSVTMEEKKTVVFRCQHGRFALESDHNELAAAVWATATKGEAVTLRYREIRTGAGEFVKYETVAVVATPPGARPAP